MVYIKVTLVYHMLLENNIIYRSSIKIYIFDSSGNTTNHGWSDMRWIRAYFLF